MAFQSRIPIPVNTPATRSLHKIRSEGCLKDSSAHKVRRLRSMGQLSPPPNKPLPPLPPRSSLRPLYKAHTIDSRRTSNERDISTQQSDVLDGSSYSSNDSPEIVLDGGSCSPRKRVLNHENADQEARGLMSRNESSKPPSLQDLGRLLELCNRLKEMGALFTQQGEMQAYGNPPHNADLEQMLHMGAEYDVLWNLFSPGQPQEVAHNLWPVVRVLKKMLQYEGIAFDDHHTRLNCGSGRPKQIRLSRYYDVLRQQWFDKTLSNVHPAERWHQTPAQAGVVAVDRPMPMEPSLITEEDLENGSDCKIRRAKRLTRIFEEQPSMLNEPRPSSQGVDAVYPSPLDTCGTLFNAHSRTIPASVYSSTPLRESTQTTPMMLHGSSPLQRAKTASMLLPDDSISFETRTVSMLNGATGAPQRAETKQHEHAGVLRWLVEDERQRAGERRRQAEQQFTGMQNADEETENTSNKKGRKSKAVRKWLRTMMGLKKGAQK